MSRDAIVALGAVALALLAYILVYERDSLSSGERRERRGRALETFVRDRVSAFEVQRKGRTVRLEREPSEDEGFKPWKVVRPWQEGADTDAVNALLGELEWLDARRRLEDVSDEDLARFGLDKPRLRLRYEAGRTRTLVEVGHLDVHKEGVYIRVDGGRTVQVVSKTLDEALNQDIGQFRSKQFLGELTVAWARSIDLKKGEQSWPLRREDGRWWFERQPRGLADPRAVDEWLRHFDDLRATRYAPDEDLEALRKQIRGQPSESALVKILPDAGREDQSPRILDLRVGGACEGHDDERYVTVGEGGPVVCVHQDSLAALFEDLGSLRLLGLFAFDVSEIEKLSMVTGKHELTLERDGEAWVAQEASGEPADREAVERWLADLAERRGEQVEPRAPGPTVSSLSLTLADDRTWKLELGPPGLGGSVVRRNDEPVQLTFDRTTADLLQSWPGRFRPLQLWDVQPSGIVALEVQGEGRSARKLERAELGWREVGEEELAPDAERVREIVRDLAKLRAQRWRASKALPEHGMNEPLLTLRATLEQGDSKEGESGPLQLTVGAQTQGGSRLVQVDGGAVAELPVEDVAKLQELLQPAEEALSEKAAL